MRTIIINDKEYELFDITQYEADNSLEFLPKDKSKYTKKEIEKAVEEFRNSIDLKNKLSLHINNLKDTSYMMVPDYFESLSKEEQDNLIEDRKKSIDFIKNNK